MRNSSCQHITAKIRKLGNLTWPRQPEGITVRLWHDPRLAALNSTLKRGFSRTFSPQEVRQRGVLLEYRKIGRLQTIWHVGNWPTTV